jgi:ribosome biogenesis GTPase
VLDTPGIRTIQPFGVAAAELAMHFPEFRPLLGGCRFKDCRHGGEPRCAIAAAAREGEIDPGRYASYRRILEGLVDEDSPGAGTQAERE